MQRDKKKSLWAGRRVPEVDEAAVPILYSRYNKVEEVLQGHEGPNGDAAAAQGKKKQKRQDDKDGAAAAAGQKKMKKGQSAPEPESSEEDDSSEEEEEEDEEEEEEERPLTKKEKKELKRKEKQQQQQQEKGDGKEQQEQQQRTTGNAAEARQIRSVLGFEGATAPPAKSFAFSFDAQVAAQVEAETEAKLARIHAIDSADKDGYVPRRVFVGGMPYSLTREQVEEYWSYCGEIESMDLLTFPDTGRFRGIAFITFKNEEGYTAALACDGEQLEGQILKVDKCKAAAAAPRRGGAANASTPAPSSAAAASPAAPTAGGRQYGGGGGDRPNKTPGYNVAYVGNVAFEVTREELAEVFADCGVKLVRLHTDQATGRSKGFAHVHFEDEDGLDRAMELDGHMLRGRGIRVSYGQPKKT